MNFIFMLNLFPIEFGPWHLAHPRPLALDPEDVPGLLPSSHDEVGAGDPHETFASQEFSHHFDSVRLLGLGLLLQFVEVRLGPNSIETFWLEV